MDHSKLHLPTFNIFLADDDEDDRSIFHDAIKNLFPQANYTTAENGLEMLELLQKAPADLPDIVFLDINMPKLDGLDCLKRIKSSGTLNVLPVVMLSTSNDPATIKTAFNLGALYYAVKPATFDEIKALFQKIISQVQLKGCAPSYTDFQIG